MPIRHVVAAGECIATIAFRYGHHPDTVWAFGANADLRDRRATGYVLEPGDVVVVPDIQLRTEQAATGREHVYRRRGVPEELNVELRNDDGPRAGLDYVLEIDGEKTSGTTGADGRVHAWLPLGAKEGTLRVGEREAYTFHFGHLDPVTSETGVRARLHNLGFLKSPDTGDLDDAVAQFRQRHGLSPSAAVDDDFRAALLEAHRS